MMSTQKEIVTNWLQELNNQWGIDCLHLDEESCCYLSNDEHDIAFSLSQDDEEILLWSSVVSAQAFLDENQLLTALLIMNDSDSTLMGSTFSMDSDRRYILLNYRMPIEILDARKLGDLLCNFTDIVSEAKIRLNNKISTISSALPVNEMVDQQLFTKV